MQVELVSMVQRIDFKTGEISSSIEVEFPGGIRTTFSIEEDKVLDILRQIRSRPGDMELESLFRTPASTGTEIPVFGGDIETRPAVEKSVSAAPAEAIVDEDGVSSI